MQRGDEEKTKKGEQEKEEKVGGDSPEDERNPGRPEGETLPAAKMIEKLNAMLPALSEHDAAVARYEIKKLQQANPFLSSVTSAARNVIECWFQRDLNRKVVLEIKLRKERNLLQGYKTFLASGDTPMARERVEFTTMKIYWIEDQLKKIAKLVQGAGTQASFAGRSPIMGLPEEGEGSSRISGSPPTSFSQGYATQSSPQTRKRTGKAEIKFLAMKEYNPLYENVRIEIYVDSTLAATVPASKGNVYDAAVTLALSKNLEVEILLLNPQDLLVGLIFFPVADLSSMSSAGARAMQFLIEEPTQMGVEFGACQFEHQGLLRYNAAILTARIRKHKMKKIDTLDYFKCGVCTKFLNGMAGDAGYRCDSCRFTCHVGCLNFIFFKCKKKEIEEAEQTEEEEEKAEEERKERRIKENRLKMVFARMDIRETPEIEKERKVEEKKQAEQKSEEAQKPEGEKELAPQTPVKRYSVTHTLESKMVFAIAWCAHCGERLKILERADRCAICTKQFHASCVPYVFDSCGVTPEFLKTLVEFTPPPFMPGVASGKKIVLEDFELLRVLGRGSFGKVLLARWQGAIVALKIVKKVRAVQGNNAVYLETERRCLEISHNAGHPFLLGMRGCFQTAGNIFFVLEFVPGGDLMHHAKTRTFKPSEVRLILAEIVLALEFLHAKGIIYRDMKLDNVMIDSGGHVKLADFGLCSVSPAHGVAHTFCGTLENIAPEVVLERGYTKDADWWGVGIVAYELMLLEPPFTGNTPSEVCKAILHATPVGIAAIEGSTKEFILALLQKDPKERLGYGAEGSRKVKSHQYFEGLDWEKVYQKKVSPEWAPEKDSARNFDIEFTKEKIQITPAPSVDKGFNQFFVNF